MIQSLEPEFEATVDDRLAHFYVPSVLSVATPAFRARAHDNCIDNLTHTRLARVSGRITLHTPDTCVKSLLASIPNSLLPLVALVFALVFALVVS